MSNPIVLIVVGLIIWAVSLAPFVPPAWRPFVQAIGGILAVVGLILLVLILLGVSVASGVR